MVGPRDAQGTHTRNGCVGGGIHARAQYKEALAREGLFFCQLSTSHPIPPHGIATTNTSHLHPKAQYLQHSTLRVLRLFYRCSRRRLGSPWVGPINAALKRLKLPTVTPQGQHQTCPPLLPLSLSLPVFERLFFFPHPRGHKPTALLHTVCMYVCMYAHLI